MAHLKPGKKEVNRTESFLKDIKNSFRHYKLDNSIEERHRLAKMHGIKLLLSSSVLFVMWNG